MSQVPENQGEVALKDPPGDGRDDVHPGRKCVLQISYNGENKQLPVELTMTVATVVQEAIREFHITQNPHLLSLYAEDGRALHDGESLAAQNVQFGVKLLFCPVSVKGGIADRRVT